MAKRTPVAATPVVENPAQTGRRPVDLTDKAVAALPLGSGLWRDSTMRGFYVVCNAASKSFVLQRDVNGRAVRVNLGQHGDISARSARELAEDIYVNKIKKGIDPNREKQDAKVRGMTLGEAFELYKSGGHEWSPKTLEEYEGVYKRELSQWANRTMQEIGEDRTGVQKLHTAIYERVQKSGKKRKRDIDNPDARPGAYTANRALELLGYVYNRARRQLPSLPPNPIENVTFFKKRQRNDSISPDGLKAWFEKVNAKCSPVKRIYGLSVILTAGRRDQMAEARWEHIDFDKGTWFFPKPKGGTVKAYTIPVSRYLLDELRSWRREAGETPWVFPSDRKNGAHIMKPRDDKHGLPLPHVLRHTYRTHALIARVDYINTCLLMNHAIGGSSAGYITRDITIEHLRVSQEQITAHFLRQFGLLPALPSKVIEMPNLLAKSGT